jgi:hypothetical protein
MNYIDKVLANYLKTFKVNKEFEFVTNHGNAFQAKTYKDLNIYYVKYSRISSDGTKITFYQENHAENLESFKNIVQSVTYYLNNYA